MQQHFETVPIEQAITNCVPWFAFGALIVQALDLAERRWLPKAHRPNFRDWLWLPFIVSPIAGGALGLTYVLSKVELTPLVALNVGAAAPVIFRSFARGRPDGGPGPFN